MKGSVLPDLIVASGVDATEKELKVNEEKAGLVDLYLYDATEKELKDNASFKVLQPPHA